MVYTVAMLTVKQLAHMAGVTPRTLHYYDEIGLLKPTQVGENGYRYYGDEAMLRLQQILLYRELDVPLDQIRKIMGRRDFDVQGALEGHRAELEQRILHLQGLIRTVDRTILYLKGETTMSNQQLFGGFNEEEQAKMEEEAAQMYDPETVRESNRRWRAYSAAEKQRVMDEGNEIYTAIIAAMPKGPEAPEVQALIERWRRHMDYFWTPNLEQLVALADHYSQEPRFKVNFDQMQPGLAEFMGQAVRAYVSKQTGR